MEIKSNKYGNKPKQNDQTKKKKRNTTIEYELNRLLNRNV